MILGYESVVMKKIKEQHRYDGVRSVAAVLSFCAGGLFMDKIVPENDSYEKLIAELMSPSEKEYLREFMYLFKDITQLKPRDYEKIMKRNCNIPLPTHYRIPGRYDLISYYDVYARTKYYSSRTGKKEYKLYWPFVVLLHEIHWDEYHRLFPEEHSSSFFIT
jgi:hypothetical protein